MIEVKNVVKTFDGFAALDGASIAVPDGGVYGLVGPNGAGKSTIIRHLTGICRPDSGEVLVDGAPVYENPPYSPATTEETSSDAEIHSHLNKHKKNNKIKLTLLFITSKFKIIYNANLLKNFGFFIIFATGISLLLLNEYLPASVITSQSRRLIPAARLIPTTESR